MEKSWVDGYEFDNFAAEFINFTDRQPAALINFSFSPLNLHISNCNEAPNEIAHLFGPAIFKIIRSKYLEC